MSDQAPQENEVAEVESHALAALGDFIDAFMHVTPEMEAQMEKEMIDLHNEMVDSGNAPGVPRIWLH